MKPLSLGFLIISIALILLFSMPCYAQIETQRFFTPEGSRWKINSNSMPVTEIGFFEGSIYFLDNNNNWQEFGYYNYKKRLIFKFHCVETLGAFSGVDVQGYIIPILKYGKMEYCYYELLKSSCVTSTLTKIDDNFSPEP